MSEVAAPERDIAAGADHPAAGGRRRIAPLVVAAVAVVLGGLFWILLAAEGDHGATADTPLLDRPAPASAGSFEDGTRFELSRRKGSWVVLNFFTHDCVPCVREHPELIDFVAQQRALAGDGAEFYSVVISSTRDEVAEFFELRGGGDWPVVFDDDVRFQIDFGVVQVPETWIIDPDGIVRGRIISEVRVSFGCGGPLVTQELPD